MAAAVRRFFRRNYCECRRIDVGTGVVGIIGGDRARLIETLGIATEIYLNDEPVRRRHRFG